MPTFGLQFSQIYGYIQDYANINNLTNAATKAKQAANNALRLIATLRNWEALKRESSVTPVASQQSYAILTGTTDFDHMISCWYILAGERLTIDLVDDEKWNDESNNTIVGTPEICRVTHVNGSLQIQFSPAPSSSFITQSSTINFDYVKKPTELVNDTDIPDIPDTSEHMAIVYMAVADLVAKQGDLKAMAIWEAKAKLLIDSADKIDDLKEGRSPRIGRPLIPIGNLKGISGVDYRKGMYSAT